VDIAILPYLTYSLFRLFSITIIYALSGNINYHQLSSVSSIIHSSWMEATSLMLYAFSIYRRVRRYSYYFLYITYITYTITITIMRYAYCIYFTITIITCIAITITIIIMLYFRKNFGNFFRPYLVPFYGYSVGWKTKPNID